MPQSMGLPAAVWATHGLEMRGAWVSSKTSSKMSAMLEPAGSDISATAAGVSPTARSIRMLTLKALEIAKIFQTPKLKNPPMMCS